MKLRNKKTGEIIEYDEEVIYYRKLTSNGHEDWTPYHPEDWEDYIPVEPYIEDVKVRKFVRDWAEHWRIDKVVIRFIDSDRIDLIGFPGSNRTGREIDIQRAAVRDEIAHGHRYTIAELCGEEEE